MTKTNFIAYIALFCSLIGCIVLFNKWRATTKEYNTLYDVHQQTLTNAKIDTLVIREYFKDTVNNTSGVGYNPIQTTGSLEGYVSKGVVDTMARALNVAANKIERLNSMLIAVEAKAKGTRSYDSVKQEEWLVMKNDPTFDIKVNLSNDSIYPGVRLRLTQAYAPYRKNIFSKYEYRSVIKASDHRVILSEIIDVNKVPRSPRWGISAFGGPILTADGLTYGVGLGLTYDIIQFKK